MNLLVDIGNSRVKWVLSTTAGLGNSQSADHQSWLQSLQHKSWISELDSHQPIQHIYLASVGNEALVQKLEKFLAELSIPLTRLTTQKNWQQLKNSYTDPTQMGVDRWLAMMASWNSCQSACLVIDCGTAITVDAIDQRGIHLGGHIVSGLTLQKSILLAETDKVHAQITYQGENTAFADNTSDAVNFGCLQLVVDYLTNSWDRFQSENPSAKLFICGGDGELLSELLDYRDNFRQDLVLEGMMLAANEHVEQ